MGSKFFDEKIMKHVILPGKTTKMKFVYKNTAYVDFIHEKSVKVNPINGRHNEIDFSNAENPESYFQWLEVLETKSVDGNSVVKSYSEINFID